MSDTNVNERWESFLPDEIVLNILSRLLEAKDVLRCRCVVKRWMDLTSTPSFVDFHKQHRIGQMILVDVQKRGMDQFFLDEWWLTARKKPIIQKVYSHPLSCASFSQDGLLVMSSMCTCSKQIVIVNPIFHEKVKIVISLEWHSSIRNVYGVYFNPTLKEYCALFAVSLRSTFGRKPGRVDASTIKAPNTYKMLTMGPKPCLRDIRNPYKDRYPAIGSISNRPVMVDGFLYWMIDLKNGMSKYTYFFDIMEFDIRSEEFKVIQYPGEMIDYGEFDLDLLNIDGFLTLVQLAPHQDVVVVVNMWTLKDRASESWTFSHYNVNYQVYPVGENWMWFETIAYKNGVLLFRSDQRFYVCNLELGTTKVLDSETYNESLTTFFSHDICLTSLKNCKPVIHIGKRNKCQYCIRLDKEEASSSNSSNISVNEHSDVVEEIAISALDEGAGSSRM